MARYIFPGADASLTLSGMIRAAEDGGFEVTDVEDMTPRDVMTLRARREDWVSNRDAILRACGAALIALMTLLPALVRAHR